MREALLGGIAVAAFAVGLFFLRYWRSTRDPFFAFLMAAFWLESASHALTAVMQAWNENSPARYAVRVLSYGLILLAIVCKNRRRG